MNTLESKQDASNLLDQDAFYNMVKQTQGSLFRVALGITGSRAISEELIQDCYLISYEALLDGRWKGEHVKSWTQKVLVRLAIRRMQRHRRRNQIMQIIGLNKFFEHKTNTNEQGIATDSSIPPHFMVHLHALPVMQRSALILHVVEGLSARQVAEQFGKSEGAVEQLLVRAKKTLKQRLEEDHDER